jgi:hypothetical protein
MIKYRPIAFIVPINFAHKAGDGISTRDHHLKDIHPALQMTPGVSQATYVLEVDEKEVSKCNIQMR